MKVFNIDLYKFIITLLIILFFQFFSGSVFAQDNPKDTVSNSLVKTHSPEIATICSAVVPGLGQVYNKKIWKVPIIYLGLGALIYYFNQNNITYKLYKDYLQKDTLTINGDIITGTDLNPYKEEFRFYRDKYRRFRDLNAIGLFVIYILNIVDANVDANLFDFDVNDDLTFRIEPSVQRFASQRNNAFGMTCKINF